MLAVEHWYERETHQQADDVVPVFRSCEPIRQCLHEGGGVAPDQTVATGVRTPFAEFLIGRFLKSTIASMGIYIKITV